MIILLNFLLSKETSPYKIASVAAKYLFKRVSNACKKSLFNQAIRRKT